MLVRIKNQTNARKCKLRLVYMLLWISKVSCVVHVGVNAGSIHFLVFNNCFEGRNTHWCCQLCKENQGTLGISSSVCFRKLAEGSACSDYEVDGWASMWQIQIMPFSMTYEKGADSFDPVVIFRRAATTAQETGHEEGCPGPKRAAERLGKPEGHV